jgi:hypothetical protein
LLSIKISNEIGDVTYRSDDRSQYLAVAECFPVETLEPPVMIL